MMGLKTWPHLLESVAAFVGEVDRAQLPSSHFSLAIGPAEIGDARGVTHPLREHMALNQPPVNWVRRSLQMVQGTPKTVSQSRIIMPANFLG